MPSIQFTDINKSFGATQVLRGVSVDIADGEFVALLGPSGCGKTTLLRILAGLEEPETGSVTIDGREITGLDPAARNLAFVFQSYALYPHKTVFENIAFPLRMRAPWYTRIPFLSPLLPGRRALDAEIAPRVREVAAQVGIEPYLQRKPVALSGGQRQRVALARALVREPAAFLMDEPLSNLDAKLRASMRVEISELQRRLRATFVYVTHDQVEAMTMADRVVLLNEGVAQQVGPPMELYDNPANRFVAEFIGTPTINMLPLRAGGDGPDLLGGVEVRGVPQAVRDMARRRVGAVWIGLRPDWVRPAGKEGEGVPCVVRLVEPLGNEAYVTLAVDAPAETPPPDDGDGGGRRIVMCVPPGDVGRFKAGARIRVQPDWGRALVFDEAGKRIARQPAREAA